MTTVTTTPLAGLLVVEPTVHRDDRGTFFESWKQPAFDEAVGHPVRFVQDNHSSSRRGVLRGLHYQVPPQVQGKLVRCTAGVVFEVAVDIRRGSNTFGRWWGTDVSADNHRQLWVPPGFAHGFLTRTDHAEVQYKATGLYAPDHERCIAWDDPAIGIQWPLDGPPMLSPKDAQASPLAEADAFEDLPTRP